MYLLKLAVKEALVSSSVRVEMDHFHFLQRVHDSRIFHMLLTRTRGILVAVVAKTLVPGTER